MVRLLLPESETGPFFLFFQGRNDANCKREESSPKDKANPEKSPPVVAKETLSDSDSELTLSMALNGVSKTLASVKEELTVFARP